DLVSGIAARVLAQSKYSTLVFSAVKNLEIRFIMGRCDASHVSSFKAAYVPSFYQQLKLMFPR
ncbi:hypothetical protein GGI19_006229, partial [Coemansia pectinata]